MFNTVPFNLLSCKIFYLKENKNLILNCEQNEFSDKPPRPSKALVDIKQYKQLIEKYKLFVDFETENNPRVMKI